MEKNTCKATQKFKHEFTKKLTTSLKLLFAPNMFEISVLSTYPLKT